MEGIVRIGRGPAAEYGLAAPIAELGASWPLYAMDRLGAPEQIGRLHALAGGAWWLENAGNWPCLLTGDFEKGIFPGLPWFLDDARAQGFLGRAFARKFGSQLGQGGDPALWPNPAVAESLLRFGGDLPGAFVLGRAALARAIPGTDAAIVPTASRAKEYPRLAAAVLGGEVTGSSAGGEEPKFAAVLQDCGALRHVLVKFSPPMSSPEGRRWADLLAAEMLAAQVLGANGFAAPRLEILDTGERRFLQGDRFDRTSMGRVAVVSLRALDAAFFGLLHTPWTEAASRLLDSGWLPPTGAARLASLGVFGRLIHNTDMHYGNASVILSPRLPAALAPVYDMLPMGYRPGNEGRVPGISEAAIALLADEPQSRERDWARAFWAAAAASSLISPDFRAIAAAHCQEMR